MKVVYLAVPSAGAVENGALTESFLTTVAKLHEMHPTAAFIVPMITGFAIRPHCTLETTWPVWAARCRAQIELSDEVWVVIYPGWAQSIGVQAELDAALRWGLPVEMVEPITAIVSIR